MAPHLLALALAALCAAGAAAAYRPGPESAPWLEPFEAIAERVASGAWRAAKAPAKPASRSHADDRAYVAVRYFVDPTIHDKFVEAWRDLEKNTAEEKGNCVFDLKKSMADDVSFLSYGEWDSPEDLEEHAESDHLRKFYDALEDLDVPFSLQPLYNPKDAGELTRGKKCRGDEDNGGKRHKRMAHVLIRYMAPPSAHDDLVDAWHEALKGTEQEEGIRIYSLRKVLSNNIEFYGYGTWDSMEDFHRHFESEHISKLRDRLADIHAYWHVTPLVKIGDQPE